MNIGKEDLLNNYYYDEFLIMIDEYNEMNKIEDVDKDKEVGAGSW